MDSRRVRRTSQLLHEVGTDRTHHASIRAQFPALAPHFVLGKWLYIDSTHPQFEATVEAVSLCMIRNDHRFGVVPRSRKPPPRKKTRARP